MTDPYVLIITGMHRSGTSLTAGLFHEVGINVGDHLIGPDKGNSFGYFEDANFNSFHVSVLNRFRQSFLVQDINALGEPDQREVEEALSLIERRSKESAWGWKDPRTSLFLDFWHKLLPQAYYVFVYRHPLEVTLSLLRRGKDFDWEALANPLIALSAWRTYNQCILEFYREHPDICFLANISTVVNDVEGFIDLASKKLRIPLQKKDDLVIYQPNELKHLVLPTETAPLLERFRPGIMTLYGQLESQADLPGQVSDQSAFQPNSQLNQMQSLISNLTDYGMFGQEQRLQLFSLLLTIVAPEAVLAGKSSLDNIRVGQISQLQAQVNDLQRQLALKETQVNDLQQRLVNKETQVNDLQQRQLALKETQVNDLQQRLVNKETQVNDLQQRLVNAQADKETQIVQLQQQLTQQGSRIQNLQQQVTHTGNQIGNLQQQLGRKEAELNRLTQELATIKGTKAWRTAMKWYSFKQYLQRSPQPPLVSAPANPLPTPPNPQSSRSEKSIFTNSLRREVKGTSAILFISHDAGRTGAPIILLNFLKWLKENSSLPFEILLKHDGELRSEFETLAPTIVWNSTHLKEENKSHHAQVITHLKQANIGLIYSNTITNGDILAALSNLTCPVITHVHELEYWIKYRVNADDLKCVQKYTHTYIAVSQAVKQTLIDSLKISDSNISLIYEFILTEPDFEPASRASMMRRQLNIPDEALIVGGSGTTDWRKGADLFVQLAQAVHRHHLRQPVHFVWVGGDNQGLEFRALWHDVQRVGLDQQIHFTGTRPNPLDYFTMFDVFALVSREDPFPLVNLEAASLGKPIVCFDNSGGAREFVGKGAGYVVSYLDITSMADRIVELLQTPELREQMGKQGAEEVRRQHDLVVVAPKILEIINSHLNKEQLHAIR